MHDAENPFADMEVDWQNIEKAEPGFAGGRLPEFGAYHGVCVAFDPGATESEELVDKHYFVTPQKTKAIKIALEILEPEKVGEATVKGAIHEHVFWITPKNWPYARRDAEIILGKEIKHPNELLSAVWAGHTVEFGVKDDLYLGTIRSKTSFFNAWAPEKKEEPKKSEKQVETKKTAAQPAKGVATATAKKEPVDF